MSKRDLTLIIVSTGVVLASLVAPYLIHKPELNFDPVNFFPGEWNLWTAFPDSLRDTLRVVDVFLLSFNAAIIPIFAMGVGLLFMRPVSRRIWIFVAFVLVGFLVSSLVYIVPWFGQLVFERAWVPMNLFLFGLIGFSIDASLQKIAEGIKRSKVPFLVKAASKQLFIPNITLLLVLFSLITFIPFYLRHYFLTLDSTIDNRNSFFNSTQPDMIFQDLPEDHRVLYTTEVGLYAYLTYGGLQHGAIFYPAINGTNEENYWINQKASSIDFIVSGNQEKLSELASDLMLDIEIIDNRGITVLARVIH